MKKAIFLDRDGVINQDSPNYIKSVDEFIFLPGSIEAIAKLTQAGYWIGIATNQSGLARGYYDETMLSEIHKKMIHGLESAGGKIDAILYCKHLPQDGCFCRKPHPGLLYGLANLLNCAPNHIPFIGDKLSDVDAAVAAKAVPMVVQSQMTETKALFIKYPNVLMFSSLLKCVDYLLSPAILNINSMTSSRRKS